MLFSWNTWNQTCRVRSIRRTYRLPLRVVWSTGSTITTVGGELGISEITVKAHRGQVMRKMKAGSLPALVTMASKLAARTAPTV
jgi:FixJ family two-component response regulator